MKNLVISILAFIITSLILNLFFPPANWRNLIFYLFIFCISSVVILAVKKYKNKP
ncbi:hypothetical protein [Clostridium brassicae]|uniref:Uncharacterized protein n=1 Tax=Clostridium brassicae TaxID=2999072 RepID=A0ABT4D5W2_9CLOT|nr:hypothetical protein [Clostridium brassicae]MCY6957686.1 hypothetical protein [Clostridium brassicae]